MNLFAPPLPPAAHSFFEFPPRKNQNGNGAAGAEGGNARYSARWGGIQGIVRNRGVLGGLKPPRVRRFFPSAFLENKSLMALLGDFQPHIKGRPLSFAFGFNPDFPAVVFNNSPCGKQREPQTVRRKLLRLFNPVIIGEKVPPIFTAKAGAKVGNRKENIIFLLDGSKRDRRSGD